MYMLVKKVATRSHYCDTNTQDASIYIIIIYIVMCIVIEFSTTFLMKPTPTNSVQSGELEYNMSKYNVTYTYMFISLGRFYLQELYTIARTYDRRGCVGWTWTVIVKVNIHIDVYIDSYTYSFSLVPSLFFLRKYEDEKHNAAPYSATRPNRARKTVIKENFPSWIFHPLRIGV